ncbi:MAG TPA: DNA repair exonuclease [Gemmatimonadaceae bacterium]|nr:DNA repair exonuclease [Gemmatimonadaceae bacterium]
MRLVHLSDLHLGFRQYQRLTPAGINQREADVARAFRNAIDKTIELAPDLVVIAGDVFHNVRPTNPAILVAFRDFARLRAALPEAKIVIVAGNHDTPRTAETGCILRLFEPLDVNVIESTAERLSFPERELSILAVPDVPGPRPALVPDGKFKYNVLLLHGEVEGVIPEQARVTDRASVAISEEELGAAQWSYVALGHYHVYRQVAPNAFYSGSIEYTSANSWGELAEERETGVGGKGLIEHDLANGTHRFHRLPSIRRWVDLSALSARGLSAAELDAAIRRSVEECDGGIDDQVVRLLARDVPRHIARDLDQRALREFRKRALHFHLDTRRPEVIRLHGHGSPGRRPSLRDVVRDKLRGRIIESDLSREALVDLGIRYLDAVEKAEIELHPVNEGAT